MSTRSERTRFASLAMMAMLVVWAIAACAQPMLTPPPGAGPTPRGMPLPPNPPVLEDSFAFSSVPLGSTWNVFIQGSDPDGDMSHLWIVVTQLGKKDETETIPLLGPDQRAFSGYITIYPRGANFSTWENMRVEVRIRDMAGHVSARQEHEVQLGFQTREMLPPQWANATQHKMGTILFDLERDDGDPRFGRRRW